MQEYRVVRYSFSELSPEAQEKAIEKECENASEWVDYDSLTQVMHDELESQFTGDVTQMKLDDLTFPEWDLYRGELHIAGHIMACDAPLLNLPDNTAVLEFRSSSFYGSQLDLYDIDGNEIDTPEELCKQLRTIQRRVLQAGQNDYNYLTGAERAREHLVEDDECNYLVDGTYDSPRGIIE